jgi:C1A family cysteine protease
MKKYVGSTGPLSVCGHAKSWQHYKGGILTTCASGGGHCFQIVGYGEDKGVSYWKVRNSWGTGFGENGFIRIQIGENLCNINGNPSKVSTASADDTIVV